ncbi:cysteine desulfurase NifS [Thermoanaerobacterium thermosaccharolyticum]|uniref:Cysteine desulfurase IscS n=1 Tax=Thermoanaerobacterium thermosaccharolyticum (strain ATCC 7956 / DSM 571 / NCIMB 9385 / NCA 3814 / NCTC 13789 / WDCM 00135 / 2032) TaxID=580327 RepID=D9TPT8_THETC|nr:cysteine desulfurase NifS [Thermoanaerobacterium thermosaccharolyticum]ADL68770.1 cysteine desulfurase NifS [Thermoanaerobacterium thermosaccharolyticum DSM 571]KAA5807583.1 cysteine desulfurase NifS [Thermoanaerobacterium thermosaccharolyticum]TCW37310.1 cysteine desulfurase [Thermohydrogenium kirishiense]
MNRIYLDNAATTPIRSEVLNSMMPFFDNRFGNPSALYSYGQEAKKAIEEARDKVAAAIGASEDEIFFTSGGTESDNWALKGAAYALKDKGNHIITSSVEHHAILHTCQYLENQGFEITYLPVDEYGLVDPNELKRAIKDNTILVSIMYANNEIGTIEPIEELVKVAHEKGVLFHTDAVQAVGNVPVDVKKLNVDMLSMSAHKIYGPKGVGALYIRKGLRIDTLLQGGAQERNRRAGTENVAGVVGFGTAIELITQNIDEHIKKLTMLRDKLIDGILKIPYTRLNGHPIKRLPGNVNVSFEFVDGESLILSLDMEGICVSSGSACTAGSIDPSHVLLAIGLPEEIAHGSLRLTIGEENTEEEIDTVINKLPKIVDRLRQMSPLFERIKKEKKLV